MKKVNLMKLLKLVKVENKCYWMGGKYNEDGVKIGANDPNTNDKANRDTAKEYASLWLAHAVCYLLLIVFFRIKNWADYNIHY